MVNIAVFASGNGSNFEELAKGFKDDKKSAIRLLIYDRKDAFVVKRAEKYGILAKYINYVKQGKDEAEKEIVRLIIQNSIDIIFLAGFMRILDKNLIDGVKCPIINIHPSLLPKHKGSKGIEDAFLSNDKTSGITIHYVNEELDSGEMILQKSICVNRKLGIDHFEKEIHKLEHKWYPKVAKKLVNKIVKEKSKTR